jgi:pimeloyl-ACP methyl ester carboxylesterase
MDFPGKKSDWNGFERFDFELEGISCIIVRPESAVNGNLWVWRARFFDAFPNLDIAMLQQGWFLAYIDIADLYGAEEAMRRFDVFHRYLTQKFGFARKAALEGFSRGGLAVFNWACRCPEKVCCVYADNPVCDFKSWPGGLGSGPGSESDWAKCLIAYGLDEEQARSYTGNPVDKVNILVKNNIPVMIVYGDADEVVPIPENTQIMLDKFAELGVKVETVCKKGGLHHPHCLEDPAVIVDFIKKSKEA